MGIGSSSERFTRAARRWAPWKSVWDVGGNAWSGMCIYRISTHGQNETLLFGQSARRRFTDGVIMKNPHNKPTLRKPIQRPSSLPRNPAISHQCVCAGGKEPLSRSNMTFDCLWVRGVTCPKVCANSDTNIKLSLQFAADNLPGFQDE